MSIERMNQIPVEELGKYLAENNLAAVVENGRVTEVVKEG